MDTINIRIFDKDINFIGEVDNFTSLIYTRKWETYGEFEIHLPISRISLMKKNNIIMLNNDGYRTGVIEHMEINEKANEEITVKGYSLSYWLTQRLTVPPTGYSHHSFNTSAEDIMIALVRANAVEPIEIKRRIPKLTFETSKSRGDKLQFQTRYKVLGDELTKISKATGLGFTIFLDYKAKKFIFKVIEGKNLTYSQDFNPPVIFSTEYDNILKENYKDSNIGYKNVGYIAGQGEGVDREIEILNNELSGLDRRETFIDARDINEAGSLSDRGKVKLSETPQIINFECEVETSHYRITWDLGDLVTVVNKKLSIKLDNRVSEVREVYENGFKVEPTFGTSVPLVGEKIKQITDEPLSEGVKGATGEQGPQGYSLQYNWNGTSLGIKREDETSYDYKNLIGPRGPQGIKGDKGDTGVTGPQGLQGIQGPKGDTGANGFTWRPSIDSSGNLTWSNNGSTIAPTNVNIKGPKGDQGIQGIKGDKGDIGLTGPQGPAGKDGTQIITSNTQPSGQVKGGIWIQTY